MNWLNWLEPKKDATTVDTDRALILYRDTTNKDKSICAVLHEVGHELFPEWNAEPNDTSLSELGIFERDMKAFCDAVGVDLAPLLVKSEPEVTASRKRTRTRRR